MDIDIKYLYETIGLLFVKNREVQDISEQLQKMLGNKQQEVEALKEQLGEYLGATKSEE